MSLIEMRLPSIAVVTSLLLLSAVVFAGDYEDGVAAISNGDHEIAFVKFRQAAEQGDARAQRSLASMYFNGLGTAKNEEQAFYWYTKAAEQGDADAQYTLGLMYAEGIGVSKDTDKALFWYSKAAAQGHPEALGIKRRWTVARQNSPRGVPARSTPSSTLVSTGTGFYVSSKGDVLTNLHVVQGCSSLKLQPIGKSIRSGRVVAADRQNDFAIVSSAGAPGHFATFRSDKVRQGESIVVYGFPLAGALASSGNATTGSVTALAGMRDDNRMLQISAPVQPGNSGGPLLDLSGAVVGVVVAKLNATQVMEQTGDIPQNINFALKTDIATDFLKNHGINYVSVPRRKILSVPDVVDVARRVSVRLLCYR